MMTFKKRNFYPYSS